MAKRIVGIREVLLELERQELISIPSKKRLTTGAIVDVVADLVKKSDSFRVPGILTINKKPGQKKSGKVGNRAWSKQTKRTFRINKGIKLKRFELE